MTRLLIPFLLIAIGATGAMVLRSPKDAANQPRRIAKRIVLPTIVRKAVVKPLAPRFPAIYAIPVRFPPSASNCLNWDVLESHDLKNWHVIDRNVYPEQYCAVPTSAPSFYRFAGR